MKILISPTDVEEAILAFEAGADIIDIKNPREGSLGAAPVETIERIVGALGSGGATLSATLGDLPYKPGTASLAARGLVSCGVHYIKAGLYGPQTIAEGIDLMRAIVTSCKSHTADVTVVAAGYADYARFNGLSPLNIVDIAHQSGADMVMLDTFYKDGQNLFDALSETVLASFITAAKTKGLRTALAGSLKREHIVPLLRLGVDVIGVRGVVCQASNRDGKIDPVRAKDFMAYVRDSRQAA
ncbi:MAG: (5-formylfuran-3-yl)methyl phosphate synthase [Alphaproteobacteria bacterium]|nr:(5-formylfuran-3-yl)methyl phosphate synthase [Alphaproteobacteria bacterium]MBV8549337.1 (5-formylfuran-3-yl)methyl phosphate synthase [Alphaproteobacteria bacterium]